MVMCHMHNLTVFSVDERKDGCNSVKIIRMLRRRMSEGFYTVRVLLKC